MDSVGAGVSKLLSFLVSSGDYVREPRKCGVALEICASHFLPSVLPAIPEDIFSDETSLTRRNQQIIGSLQSLRQTNLDEFYVPLRFALQHDMPVFLVDGVSRDTNPAIAGLGAGELCPNDPKTTFLNRYVSDTSVSTINLADAHVALDRQSQSITYRVGGRTLMVKDAKIARLHGKPIPHDVFSTLPQPVRDLYGGASPQQYGGLLSTPPPGEDDFYSSIGPRNAFMRQSIDQASRALDLDMMVFFGGTKHLHPNGGLLGSVDAQVQAGFDMIRAKVIKPGRHPPMLDSAAVEEDLRRINAKMGEIFKPRDTIR